AEVWLRRQEDEESRKRVRSRFRTERMMELLTAKTDRLGAIVRELYERCIDFGAHPNELALTTNGSMRRGARGELIFEAIYLAGLSDSLRLARKTAAQVGVGTLEVFRLVLPERFDLLSVSAGLEGAKRGL